MTEAKINLAYKGMTPEFEIDTAYHTRINLLVDVRHDSPLRKNKLCSRKCNGKDRRRSLQSTAGEKRNGSGATPVVIEKDGGC